MKQIHEPFSVSTEDLLVWEARNRKNNFFELVYILEGNGHQIVNHTQYTYSVDSLFLLPASSCHTYHIGQRTKFLFIRFTANFFVSDSNCVVDYGKWFSSLNFILSNYKREAGEIISCPEDKKKVVLLFQILMEENNHQDTHSRRIMQSIMVAILEIISRNVIKGLLGNREFQDKKFADLLLYIQYNLLDREKINPGYLSGRFHISETYFSEYFKRNAKESFQEYILKSKLKIAETRVLYTDDQLKEIAYDLGFTDSSHLNKMMKKYFSKSMKAIRETANS